MVCKTMYTGSTPVVASKFDEAISNWALSSGGEHFLDAEGARGSNPLAPTKLKSQPFSWLFSFLKLENKNIKTD